MIVFGYKIQFATAGAGGIGFTQFSLTEAGTDCLQESIKAFPLKQLDHRMAAGR